MFHILTFSISGSGLSHSPLCTGKKVTSHGDHACCYNMGKKLLQEAHLKNMQTPHKDTWHQTEGLWPCDNHRVRVCAAKEFISMSSRQMLHTWKGFGDDGEDVYRYLHQSRQLQQQHKACTRTETAVGGKTRISDTKMVLYQPTLLVWIYYSLGTSVPTHNHSAGWTCIGAQFCQRVMFLVVTLFLIETKLFRLYTVFHNKKSKGY